MHPTLINAHINWSCPVRLWKRSWEKFFSDVFGHIHVRGPDIKRDRKGETTYSAVRPQ